MFGQQQDDQPADDQAVAQQLDGAIAYDQPANDMPLQADPVNQDAPQDAPADMGSNTPADDQAWQHPGVPLDITEPVEPTAPAPISDVIPPYSDSSFPPAQPSAPLPSPSIPVDTLPSDQGHQGDDALLDLKNQALQQLTPMIDSLEQSPEDHFRTLMMMIQASDDKDLLNKAYAAAQAIEDEHVRAQALLDVVNEINYFTQPHDDQAAA